VHVKVISTDQVLLDTLRISLDVLLGCEFETFNQISPELEQQLLLAGSESILLVDAGIPGVDYWALVGWLGRQFKGQVIILTSPNSYNLSAAKMMRLGCYAVLDKNKGFAPCWSAIISAAQGDTFIEGDSPFAQLSSSDQELARELLIYDVNQLSEMKGISQQAINKKKLAIYNKLSICSVPNDKAFRVLAKLFQYH